jgi:DAACS family dicarboxylate/amino acid:cation (Na+ or H+) symporter
MSAAIARSGKGIPLHTKILIGLVAGGIVGLLVNWQLGRDHGLVIWVNRYLAGPVGDVFLNLLFMVVMPLVFASIALGVAGLGDIRKVGRVGGKALGFFLLSTSLSATLGILLVLAVRPGSRVSVETRTELMATYAADASARVTQSEQSTFGIQTLVNIVTRNPIKSMNDGDMLGVIFWGIMFGAALTMIAAARAAPMLRVLEALQDIVIKIVEVAMLLAPYGVAGLIFEMTSVFGLELLPPLGRYVGIVLIGLILHTFVTLGFLVRVLGGLSPRLFFSRIRAPMITAFSTSSSAATLPTNIATAEKNLGIPPKIAGFVLPLGNTMCMNGTSLYEGITVIFLAQVFGVTLTVPQMVVVMAMSVITAVGAAGVPGGSLPLLVGILAMFGVPGQGIALILGIDRILDMSRTVVNITGDQVASVFVARSEGLWDPSMVPDVPMLSGGGEGLDESPGWPAPGGELPAERERVAAAERKG